MFDQVVKYKISVARTENISTTDELESKELWKGNLKPLSKCRISNEQEVDQGGLQYQLQT